MSIEIEVHESRINKLMRLYEKIVCYFLVSFGFVLICFQILIFHKWSLMIFGIVITIVGLFCKTRIAKIVKIKKMVLF